jgi:KUP system potassium uptake protein
MFALATIAAIIASQAIISATFSIVKQSVALGCFPRVKIVHTSDQFQGQIYIPEINWILMILCLVITAGFRDTRQIGNAYGILYCFHAILVISFLLPVYMYSSLCKHQIFVNILLDTMSWCRHMLVLAKSTELLATLSTGIAVVAVMLVTTYLMTLVIIMVWHKPLVVGLMFLLVFGSVESVYVSSVLFKVKQGGWVPLVVASALASIMYVWNYGTLKRYQYENQNKVSVGWVLGLGPSLGLVRVPGVGLVYTDLAHGVPPLFSHFITHLPAIHSTVVFVCIKYLPVNTVPQEERFLVRRIGTKAYSMYRCAARYGYRDLHKRDEHFEQLLFQSLIRFNKFEALRNSTGDNSLAASWTPEERSVSSIQAVEMAPQNPIMDDSMSQGDGLEINSIADSSIQLQSVSEGPFQEIPATERRGVHFPTSPSTFEEDTQDALTCLMRGRDEGVTYIIGDTIVKARRDAGFLKKLVINHVYTFLRKTCRENTVALNIPHESLLQVGMIYYV